jgi:ureidoglycolate lyase
MSKLIIKELSGGSFTQYGSFAKMIGPDTYHFGENPIKFYRDMLQLELGNATQASFSVCQVKQRPLVIDVTEYHSSCGEGILPLDADILIHVGPASPNGETPLNEFEVFKVKKGTMVILKPGVFHHAPFVTGADVANVLIVLPQRTYANDCEVFDIKSDDQLEIE